MATLKISSLNSKGQKTNTVKLKVSLEQKPEDYFTKEEIKELDEFQALNEEIGDMIDEAEKEIPLDLIKKYNAKLIIYKKFDKKSQNAWEHLEENEGKFTEPSNVSVNPNGKKLTIDEIRKRLS